MKRYEPEAYMMNLGADRAAKMKRKKNGNYVRYDEANEFISKLANHIRAGMEPASKPDDISKYTAESISLLKQYHKHKGE